MKWTSMMVLSLIALLGNQPSLAQRPASFAGFVSNVFSGFSRAVFRTATVTVVTGVTTTETYTATTTVTTTVNTEKSFPPLGFFANLEVPKTTSTTTEPSTTTTTTTTTEASTTSTTTPVPTLDEPSVNGTSFIISTSFNGISSIQLPDTSSIQDSSTSSAPLKSTASSNNKNIKPSVATFTPQLPKKTSSTSSKKAPSTSLKIKTKSSTRFFTASRNSKELSEDEPISIVPFEVLTVETSVTATPIVPYFVKRSIDIESSIATGGHKHTGASASVTDTNLFGTV